MTSGVYIRTEEHKKILSEARKKDWLKRTKNIANYKKQDRTSSEYNEKRRKRYKEDVQYRERQKLNRTRYLKTKNGNEWKRKYMREYNKKKLFLSVEFKLAKTLRNRLRNTLKYQHKTGSSIKDLGCSVEELKIHLENLFSKGVTWENHGVHGWHIDHIIPLSSFDLTKREQFLKACHYTNLQQLWAKDNLLKSNKIT